MTRVLHVIDKMDPERGGVCQAVRTIALGLNGLGVHNEIVSLDANNAQFLNNDTLTIHALGPAENPWSFSKHLKPWLLKHLQRFHIVVVHGLWQYPSYAVYKTLSKLVNPPKLYVMPHGMLDPYFQRATGRKLKAIRNIVYWALIEKHVINKANALLFTCEAEKQLASQPFKPYKPNATIVVGLGVETPPPFNNAMLDAFYTICPEIKSHRYLLFISRIHEKKGVDLLLHAYAKTAELYGNEAEALQNLPKLVIAGPGLDTPYGKSIQDIVNNNALLKANVFFPGMLKGDAKWGSFYGCEAFVLPSHQENFGIAVVEALACAKPVLISNQVNIWAEIKKTGAGIVNTDTIMGTYDSLNMFLSLNSVEKSLYQQKAKQCFETYFAVEPAAKQFFNAISK